jgi:4-hydroxybenzoate polyprenyltransferase
MSLPVAAIKAMRPKQWAKNVFLFAALIFSLRFKQSDDWILTLYAFMAFSLVSSSGYILNDSMDVEADRNHPKKKHRPLASGALPIKVGYAVMVIIFAMGMSIAYSVSPWLLLVTCAYFTTTVSYSLFFKNFVILDVMFIASGFLWRVVAGAVAIDVAISPWLLTCTAFLALFLGFNKRRGELLLVKEGETRKNLKDYSIEMVQEFQAITTSGAIISYALYTVMGSHNNPWLLITLPYVLYGIFRYIYLVNAHGEGGAPDETLLKDKPILINGILYVATAVAVLTLGSP